jgi:hypothetical protein
MISTAPAPSSPSSGSVVRSSLSTNSSRTTWFGSSSAADRLALAAVGSRFARHYQRGVSVDPFTPPSCHRVCERLRCQS